METRAHYLIVGTFVLAGVAGVFFFLIWLTRAGVTRETAYYDIHFRQSVAGLVEGGDVRYRGIKVGSVIDIAIHPMDPQLARVTVELMDTPIREGDAASLEMQGITGVLYVNIKGADAGNPPLVALEGQERAVIPSRPSTLSSLFEDAPDLVTRVAVVMDNLAKVFGPENQETISSILDDISGVTALMSVREEQFSRILTTFDQSRDEIEASVVSLNRTLALGEGVIAEDVPRLIEEYRMVGVEMRHFVAQAEALLEQNRAPLEEFTTDGLDEIRQLVFESQQLLGRLGRLADRMESDGIRLQLTPAVREHEVRP